MRASQPLAFQARRPRLTDPDAALLNGKTIPKAKLEFMRADGDGKPVKYYQVELENVMLSHMDQVMSGGGLLHDEIGLCYSKVKWSYTQQKIAGGASGTTTGGWDLAAKKTCA